MFVRLFVAFFVYCCVFYVFSVVFLRGRGVGLGLEGMVPSMVVEFLFLVFVGGGVKEKRFGSNIVVCFLFSFVFLNFSITL